MCGRGTGCRIESGNDAYLTLNQPRGTERRSGFTIHTVIGCRVLA